eukprot:6625003-Ditylum_brightwellii.AAC.1
MDMVCNWISSNYLAKKFWYFGLRAAAHVSNYMPTSTDDGIYSSPFELAYGVKPNWRNLVPIFSVAYVKRTCDGSRHWSTADSQSIKCIC